MKIFGIGLAIFAGINTEYFAQRGPVGIVCYVALIVIAVALVLTAPIKRRSK